MNPQLNKKVKKYLDSYFRDTKTNSPEHQEAVMLVLKGALTDANFHSEAGKLGNYFPKAGKKYIGTPMEGVIESKGQEIAKMAKWDGHDIIDAFAFYLSMSIGGSFGNRLMSLKESLEESLVIEGERLDEKNCPTDASKWSYYKSQAKKKFDVYPSAYANGWASKQYKAAGGGWKQCAGESVEDSVDENFAVHMAVAKAIADQKVKNPETKKDVKATTALKDKKHPAHKQAKSLLQRLKDKFSKKENIEEGMVAPKNGHAYYKLTKDTPIKYVSGHSGIGLEVPGVLLHNEYSTIKGKKGAYIINYFNAHFYVDMKNKFASKIAHPQNREQNKDLMKNVERVFSAPEHSDWKKYMNESVNEAKTSLSNTQDKQFASAIEKVLGGKVITRKHPRGGGSIFSLGNSDIVVFVQKVVGNKAFGEPSKFAVLIEDKFGKEYAKEFASDANEALKLAVKLAKKFKNKLTESTSVNELNTKTYRSAVEKGLDRGDDKGREIARKAIELMGKSLSKELKDVTLIIKPLKVDDFHSSHFGGKPPMTGQYEIKFTGAGSLHKPDLDLDTKDITLFVKGEIGQAKEYGGWGGPIELARYIGWKPITLQLSIRNGSVEVYSYRGGGGLQFTRQGARLIAKIAKEINLSMGGDGNVKHNKIKQFTPHKNESVNEAASRTAMEIGGLTGMNKDAIQKFVDDNNLDIEKVYQFVKKGKLADRMKLVSAIAGKPNNPVQKQMVKQFSESLIKEAKVKLGKDSVNFKVMGDRNGLTLIAASGNDLDGLQDAISNDVDVKGELRNTLEKQLKVPVDIDHGYDGAGFRFNIDFYSLAKKVK